MRILVLFISSVLIYGLLAPLFRRIRATFSQFGMKLKFSPQSGKTFNDNSTKRNPLSALTRHSPRRGKLFIPAFACHSPRRGKQLSTPRITLPERKSVFRQAGRLSIFRLSFCCFPQSGRTFSLQLNQNGRKTFNNIK